MGFTLEDLSRKNERELAYPFKDGTKFGYAISINRLSIDVYNELQSAVSTIAKMDDSGHDGRIGEEEQKAFCSVLSLVSRWDYEIIVDGERVPAPLEPTYLLQLPFMIQVGMLTQIMEEINSDPTIPSESREENEDSSSDGSVIQLSQRQNMPKVEESDFRSGSV